MVRKEKEFRLKQLTEMIETAETSRKLNQKAISDLQRLISHYQKEQNEIRASLTARSKGVSVSDHALMRYLERKYSLDFEKYRQEILTPIVKQSIKAGATSIKVGGIKFQVRNNTIVTTI